MCWRLARLLAQEHGIAVRLWVDDLASLHRLCPQVDAGLAQQHCRAVEIRHWSKSFPEVPPAVLVIEAFACELPENYVAAMAAQEHKPVWVNLEYLSAEDWVGGCHKLPSPHPQLPLTKYFFFPGFTPHTGGLLLERDLLARRDAFQRDAQAQHDFWAALGLPAPHAQGVRVSLFSYENPALPALLRAWEQSAVPVSCVVPQGRVLAQVADWFGQVQAAPGDVFRRGNLELHVLPFLEQERYDTLLWACAVNFVRGEDSFVRAQWSGLALVWHIYPQHDAVHLQKLRAFMSLYCAALPPHASRALHGLWEGWNAASDPGEAVAGHWNDFMLHRSILRQHAQEWARALSHNNLALNLLDFFREVVRMRGLKI